MKAPEIATQAASLIGGDRAEAYGDAFTHYAALASLVNGYLMPMGKLNKPLDAADVLTFLELMKINRRRFGPFRADDYVDGCGYTALNGEIASRETMR